MLPLGCAAAPKPATELFPKNGSQPNGGASHPSGSKLPRHKSIASSLDPPAQKMTPKSRFPSSPPPRKELCSAKK
ncbi:hypothetical protein CEC48_07960 [Pseudomonas sp. K2I15]|nr:hypothetical protein CEC48_07960 [Pseudomonas sp. K2I15]